MSVIYLKTQISRLVIHRRVHSSRLSLLASCSYFPYLLFWSNNFQNLNVSSAEAVHRVDWSGDCAMCRTLWVCPCNSVIFLHIGSDNADFPTFHTHSWLSTYPWELMSYFCSLFHTKEHTWLYVFISFKFFPVSTFQSLRVLSAEPPPVASKFLCHGHQAKALTAALWPSK